MSETKNIEDEGMRGWLPQDADTVYWDNPELKSITRLRFISDPGFPFWDLSYCWGEMKNGERVRVQVPFFQVPKGKGKMIAEIIKLAKRDKVYAKGLGIFDCISTLT